MPGRLEFDTEVENEAEVVIKDMEFGLVMGYGGSDQPEPPPPPPPPPTELKEDANTMETEATPGDISAMDPFEKVDPPLKEDISMVKQEDTMDPSSPQKMEVDSPVKPPETPTKIKDRDPDNSDEEAEPKPPKLVFEIEDPDDVELKLTMLEIYYEKLNARTAAKDLIFDRGLMEFKKVGSGGRMLSPPGGCDR